MTAIDALRTAIQDQGPFPGYHRYVMARHREEWPALWAAIDQLLIDTEMPDMTIRAARATLQHWAERQGQDRCWWSPEILTRLATLFGIPIPAAQLPPRAAFEAGCRRYTDQQYGACADAGAQRNRDALADVLAFLDRGPTPDHELAPIGG